MRGNIYITGYLYLFRYFVPYLLPYRTYTVPYYRVGMDRVSIGYRFSTGFSTRERSKMIKKANLDVRNRAKFEGVKLWQIADKLGIRDSTFSIELRYELPEERKREIFEAINEIRKENEEWRAQTN